MARMIPSPMRPTESAAEEILWRKFESELPDEYTVVHGARWVGERHGRRGEDGEADFVILHPTRGILVLEAKSGEVFRDGPRGVWVQRAGSREHDLRDDPMRQAEDSKHFLRRMFEAMPGLGRRDLHLVHGLALPFQRVPENGLGPDAPRVRILDAIALSDVRRFVVGALASADPRWVGGIDLGDDGVARIVEVLAPRREVPVHLPAVTGHVRSQVKRLTEEQFRVLDVLGSVRRAVVSGGPGTGKTLLAQEVARRFAAQGNETLLLCFNGPLAGALKAATKDVPGLATFTFHDFCRSQGRAAGLAEELARAEGDRAGYEEQFPEILYRAAEALPARYDAIVVDEAQDFHEAWWVAIEAWLTRGREGAIYAFRDDAQDLYGRGTKIPLDGLQGPFHLTKNCRNPDEVCEVLSRLDGPQPVAEPSGIVSGRRPRLTWVADPAGFPAATARVVARLLKEGKLTPADIVVLSTHAQGRSTLGATERFGTAPASWRERASDGHVLVDTIHRYKGLESPAVVLTEIDPTDVHALATLLRVGCSRAEVCLDLLATPAARAVLEPLLPAFDVATTDGGVAPRDAGPPASDR